MYENVSFIIFIIGTVSLKSPLRLLSTSHFYKLHILHDFCYNKILLMLQNL